MDTTTFTASATTTELVEAARSLRRTRDAHPPNIVHRLALRAGLALILWGHRDRAGTLDRDAADRRIRLDRERAERERAWQERYFLQR